MFYVLGSTYNRPYLRKVKKKFHDCDIFVPYNIPDYLSLRYGNDYMIPKPFFKSSGDVNQNYKYSKFNSFILRNIMTWRDLLRLKRE